MLTRSDLPDEGTRERLNTRVIFCEKNGPRRITMGGRRRRLPLAPLSSNRQRPEEEENSVQKKNREDKDYRKELETLLEQMIQEEREMLTSKKR